MKFKDQKLGMIIIDYLQLMKGEGRSESRQQEISDISRGLKGLARELNVPVIALSQLNRKPEDKGREGRPQLSDLRESGAIEQDADIVVFIYRDEVYNGDSPEKGTAEIIVAKHRSGSVGTIRLGWQSEITAFSNLASDNQYPAGAYYNSPPAIQNNNFEEYYDELPPLPEEIQATPRKGKLDLPNF
jgi:replicative DNA helicase